jgi:hypothetical protein
MYAWYSGYIEAGDMGDCRKSEDHTERTSTTVVWQIFTMYIGMTGSKSLWWVLF